ncbi:uncharacterized protein LOC112638836 [Camponotus floridanus]|uniref:uncharacterized protein LOC112638836 n=1 Tax=Camponotus floridanus TaxID=104421 RepID=UPI000DC6A44C|nr:uncharacterized protein LOC112638836 [Camponotus floridanus]
MTHAKRKNHTNRPTYISLKTVKENVYNVYFDQLSINSFDSNVISVKTNSGKLNASENISVLALTPTIAVVHWMPPKKLNCVGVTYEVHWKSVILVNGTQQKSKQVINVPKHTYDKAIDKLKLAEQISDTDGDDGNDLKKSSYQRAKKNGSSADNSDTNDTSINKLKTRNDLELDDFPNTPKALTINKSKICEIKTSLIQVTCSKSISSQEHRTANKDDLVPQNSDTISTSNTCNAEIDLDFHNLIIRKLNAVLLNLATIDERLIKLDNQIRRNEDTDSKENEDYDFDLPADTVEQLQRIDNQLKNKCIAAEMTRQLSLLGGKDHHDVISYMMKHILTNKLAMEYSWAGAKLKNAFKNLRITICIINAARTSRSNLTNKEIEDIIARWLILAKQRFDRDLKKEERKKRCENEEI